MKTSNYFLHIAAIIVFIIAASAYFSSYGAGNTYLGSFESYFTEQYISSYAAHDAWNSKLSVPFLPESFQYIYYLPIKILAAITPEYMLYFQIILKIACLISMYSFLWYYFKPEEYGEYSLLITSALAYGFYPEFVLSNLFGYWTPFQIGLIILPLLLIAWDNYLKKDNWVTTAILLLLSILLVDADIRYLFIVPAILAIFYFLFSKLQKKSFAKGIAFLMVTGCYGIIIAIKKIGIVDPSKLAVVNASSFQALYSDVNIFSLIGGSISVTGVEPILILICSLTIIAFAIILGYKKSLVPLVMIAGIVVLFNNTFTYSKKLIVFLLSTPQIGTILRTPRIFAFIVSFALVILVFMSANYTIRATSRRSKIPAAIMLCILLLVMIAPSFGSSVANKRGTQLPPLDNIAQFIGDNDKVVYIPDKFFVRTSLNKTEVLYDYPTLSLPGRTQIISTNRIRYLYNYLLFSNTTNTDYYLDLFEGDRLIVTKGNFLKESAQRVISTTNYSKIYEDSTFIVYNTSKPRNKKTPILFYGGFRDWDEYLNHSQERDRVPIFVNDLSQIDLTLFEQFQHSEALNYKENCLDAISRNYENFDGVGFSKYFMTDPHHGVFRELAVQIKDFNWDLFNGIEQPIYYCQGTCTINLPGRENEYYLLKILPLSNTTIIYDNEEHILEASPKPILMDLSTARKMRLTVRGKVTLQAAKRYNLSQVESCQAIRTIVPQAPTIQFRYQADNFNNNWKIDNGTTVPAAGGFIGYFTKNTSTTPYFRYRHYQHTTVIVVTLVYVVLGTLLLQLVFKRMR